MHRLPIFQDSRSFDERTNRIISDVRRQIDEDLQNFGFGRKNLLLTPSLTKREDGAEEQPGGRLLSHDFFKLRPTASLQQSAGPAGRVSSPPPKKEDLVLGSPESLDEDTARSLYIGDGSQAEGGQLFRMSFDVKDFEAEDISVTVEDDALIVQAKRRTEKDGAVSTKEFNRKIKLPKDVNPEELSSTMTSDGILTIEAQVPPPPDYEASVCSPTTTSVAAESGLSEDIGQNAGGSHGVSTAAPSAAPASSSSTSSSSVSQSQSTFIPLDTPVFSSDPSTGRRRMELVLEVGSPYKPDDISVKLEGRQLIIEAVHEEKWQGKTSKVSMQRDFDLSEDIDVTSVQALLKSTGRLTITAFVQ